MQCRGREQRRRIPIPPPDDTFPWPRQFGYWHLRSLREARAGGRGGGVSRANERSGIQRDG